MVICSPDKDLAQMVQGDSVVCYDRRRETVFDETGEVEKFGVSPGSIPDLLALTGDAADGIPGIPKWGPKHQPNCWPATATSKIFPVMPPIGK